MIAGSTITQLEAIDSDNTNLTFAIVGDSSVITGVPLLRIQQLSPLTAAVLLNKQLNAAVSVTLRHDHVDSALSLDKRWHYIRSDKID